jgi:hypothetical protein
VIYNTYPFSGELLAQKGNMVHIYPDKTYGARANVNHKICIQTIEIITPQK